MRTQPKAACRGPDTDNARSPSKILLLGAACTAAYAALALSGDLRTHIAWFLATFAVLAALMILAWRRVRRDPGSLKWALGAALLFRLVAAFGDPALSDDVYRYVWDGRVQLQGIHPYAYAPSDPALAGLRDDDWESINHPELESIYPAAAQMLFLMLASVGAGPVGVKLFLGLVDFGVVLALCGLLRRCGLPGHRSMLYAWNPLAVLETAGSGHIEPVGVLLVLLATAWTLDRRPILSTLALAVSIQIKLISAVLIPGHLRRAGWRAAALLPLAIAGLTLPYALTGSAGGTGLAAYAERWEYNAFVYAGVQRAMEWVDTASHLKPVVAWMQQRLGDALPWDFLYRHVWPRDMARLAVALAVASWAVWLARRNDGDPLRDALWVLGAVVLLSPTVHPWYLLWVLPFAAARCSPGWLLLCGTVTLAYLGVDGDVPWPVRCVEYLPPLTVMLLGGWRARRRKTRDGTPSASIAT